jgi:hypothetical protein
VLLAAAGVPLVIASGYSDIALPPTLAAAPLISKPYEDHVLLAALEDAQLRIGPNI